MNTLTEITRLNSEIQSRTEKKERLDRELFFINSQLNEKKKELLKVDALIASISRLELEVKNLQAKKQVLEKEVNDLDKEKKSLKRVISEAPLIEEKESRKAVLDKELLFVQKQIADKKKELNDLSKQAASFKNLSNEVKEITSKKNEISVSLHKLAQEKTLQQVQIKEFSDVLVVKDIFETQTKELKDTIVSLESTIIDIDIERQKLESDFYQKNHDLLAKLKQIKSDIKAERLVLSKVKEEVANTEIEINKKDEHLLLIEEQIKSVKKEIKDFDSQKKAKAFLNASVETQLITKQNTIADIDRQLQLKTDAHEQSLAAREADLERRENEANEKERRINGAKLQILTMAKELSEIHGKPIIFKI